MLDKRGSNRKGQEGVTTTTLLVIVLGIVVVVLVIIGASGGLNFIFDKFKQAPGQSLQTAITSCNTAAEASLQGDFCLTFKKVTINNVEQYVTCDAQAIVNNLDPNAISYASSSCGDAAKQAQRDADFCVSGTIKGSDLGKILVNGQTCKQKIGFDGSGCVPSDIGKIHVIVQTGSTAQPADCSKLKVANVINSADITSLLNKAPTDGSKCCLYETQ